MPGFHQKSTTNPQRSAAFTLIELLVVVTIIAALLAILLPSMRRAVATARIAACGANQRQLALAAIGYAVDNRRIVPVGYVSSGIRAGNYYAVHNTGKPPVCMFGLLYTSRLVSDPRLFYCPAIADADSPGCNYNFSRSNFGPNGSLTVSSDPDDPGNAIRITYAVRPSVAWGYQFLALGQALSDDEFIGTFPRMEALAGRTIFSCSYQRYAAGRMPHLDNGTNAASMDGSVAFKPGTTRGFSQDVTLTQLTAQIKAVNVNTPAANPLITQLFELFDQRPAITH